MTRLLNDAKEAWASEYAGLTREEIDQRVRGFGAMVRGIAEDGVLSVERFAERMGLDIEPAREVFAGLFAAGMQKDESGNIVGAALTALETPHKMRLAGKELYAWCALDTLFIPGLLGETADIESTCPSSGETVRLTVSPARVESAEPAGAWLSVLLPGGSSRQLGPASPT
jgi:alkylmercury lyase